MMLPRYLIPITVLGLIGVTAWIAWYKANKTPEGNVRQVARDGNREIKSGNASVQSKLVSTEADEMAETRNQSSQIGSKFTLEKLVNLSKQLEAVIKIPKSRITQFAHDLELKRTKIKMSSKDDGASVMFMAAIQSATQADVDRFRAAVDRELAALPIEARDFFLVDAQRIQDTFLIPGSSSKVLFVQKTDYGNGEKVHYWEFDAKDTQQFQISPEGDIALPGGLELGKGRNWYDEKYKPPNRFNHLLQIR